MTLDFASTRKTVQVEDFTVSYHQAGSGPALICLHGGGPGASGWSNYNKNIGPLSEQFTVFLVDFPGFGESTKISLKEPRIAFYARIVRGFMDAMGIEMAHFIGNSLGGATTMKLALTDPGRLSRLVLMGPATSAQLLSPMPSEGIKHMMGYYGGDGPSLEKMSAFIRIMIADPSRVSDDLVKERYEMSVRPDILANPMGPPSPESPFEPMWPHVQDIAHETLLIWGREDRVIPMETGLFILGNMPSAHLHVFPKCGHWAQWEKADEFNALAAQFLLNA